MAQAHLPGFGVSLLNPEKGVLNKDLQPANIPPGSYIDALDITTISQGENTQNSYMPSISDALAYNIGAVVQQNKVIQLTIDCTQSGSQTVTIYDINGKQIQSAVTFTIATGDTATTLSNFETQFNANTSGYTVHYATAGTVTNVTLVVQIYFSDVLGYDWNIVSSSNYVIVAVLYEAYDLSVTGQQYVLRSWEDPNNNVWLWSTPCNNLPTVTTIDVIAITNVVGSKIRVQVDSTALLPTGTSIVISGALGANAATINGTWIVNNIDATHIDLQHSIWVAGGYTAHSASITLYVEGYGQIGVAVKNTNNNTWAYNYLLRSKELNFRTVWQIDSASQIDNLGYDLKWNDYNNPDRVFYYSNKEAFANDGAITAINSAGGYAYGEIASETNLIINTDVGVLTFTGQTVGGGAIGSGNWRYYVRGISADGNSVSSPTYGDILVPVYQAPQNLGGDSPLNLCGDDSTQANVPSSKINNFTLSNIPSGVFKYVELLGTQYIGLAETSYVITRLLLPAGATSFSFQHTGNETDTIPLSAAELAVIGGIPTVSRNMRLIQNYLVRSKLKVNTPYDLSVFAQSGTWGLKREVLQGVGLGSGKDTGDYIYYGEYYVPENVNSHRSLMINETYRVGLMAHYITGGWTNVYWCDDVKVDVIAAGLSYDLTTSAYQDTQIYSYYFDPYGFNLNYVLPDGKLFRDVFDRIEFCQVPIDQTNATILASGLLIIANETVAYSPDGATANYIGELNALYGLSFVSRKFGSLYFADCIWGNVNINYESGDEIINFGSAKPSSYSVTTSPKLLPDLFNEYNGYTNQTSNTNVQTIAVSALRTLDSQDYAMNFNGSGKNYSKFLNLQLNTTTQAFPTSLIYNVGTNITDGNQASNTDYGTYMCQYYRPRTNQYGNSTTGNTYVTTGAVYYITPQSPSVITTGTIHVQGDCFTQKCYLRQLAPLTGGNYTQNLGLGWYAQNRINQQMRFVGSPSGLLFPVGACNVTIWLENAGNEPINYNQGYTPRNQDQTEIGFDPNVPFISDQPTRIDYSLVKANDDLVDENRYFLPLNFQDLDLTDGPVNHMEVWNKHLITLQTRSFRNPNFNQAGKLAINNPSDIILGSGSILNTNPKTYTTFGLSNKWAHCLGKSNNSDVTFYFLDTKEFKFGRLAGDGIRCLSDEHNMSNWFANNLRFAANQDTPADNQGINMVWDERRKEVVIVVRAWMTTNAYASGTTYAAGAIVNYGTQGYNQIPAIYTSVGDGNIGHTPNPESTYWKLQPLTNSAFYNCWSLAYSEKKNGFTTFKTPLPRIMIPYGDHYLMPNTISDIGNVYEQWVGNSWASWYGGGQTSNPYVSFVVNHMNKELKRFVAIVAINNIIPYRIDFITPNSQTYLTNTDDFLQEFQKFAASVPQDTLTGNGQTQGTGDEIWAYECIVKFTFQTAVYNQLQAFYMRTSPSFPEP